jgi:hypothetical protein
MMLPTSVYQVNIRIIGIRPFAEFTLSVIRFFASLRMTSVDVIEQPRIICVDFFHANPNFENKIDKANSYSFS